MSRVPAAMATARGVTRSDGVDCEHPHDTSSNSNGVHPPSSSGCSADDSSSCTENKSTYTSEQTPRCAGEAKKETSRSVPSRTRAAPIATPASGHTTTAASTRSGTAESAPQRAHKTGISTSSACTHSNGPMMARSATSPNSGRGQASAAAGLVFDRLIWGVTVFSMLLYPDDVRRKVVSLVPRLYIIHREGESERDLVFNRWVLEIISMDSMASEAT